MAVKQITLLKTELKQQTFHSFWRTGVCKQLSGCLWVKVFNNAVTSGSESLTMLWLRCWLGLCSDLKVYFGVDLLGRSLLRLLWRLSSCEQWGEGASVRFWLCIGWRPPLVLCSLYCSPLTAWWNKVSQLWAQDKPLFFL